MPPSQAYKVGDLLVLKSGGPVMTVANPFTTSSGNYITCTWFDASGPAHQQNFHVDAVEPAVGADWTLSPVQSRSTAPPKDFSKNVDQAPAGSVVIPVGDSNGHQFYHAAKSGALSVQKCQLCNQSVTVGIPYAAGLLQVDPCPGPSVSLGMEWTVKKPKKARKGSR